jgi:hypothetical protein
MPNLLHGPSLSGQVTLKQAKRLHLSEGRARPRPCSRAAQSFAAFIGRGCVSALASDCASALCLQNEPDSDALFPPRPRRKRGGLCEMMLLLGVALFFQTGGIVSGVFLLYFLVPILR